MFSYEARLRAVQLYIKLDKRIGLTIRQLGYPTKNALLNWHREYEQHLDLPAGYVRQPRYSQALKELAVRHYLEHAAASRRRPFDHSDAGFHMHSQGREWHQVQCSSVSMEPR